MKKFTMSLLVYCGPMAYNFLHHNMQAALPSLRTVQCMIPYNYKPFREGEFHFDDLVEYINACKAVNELQLVKM